jgi:hypothetical protein
MRLLGNDIKLYKYYHYIGIGQDTKSSYIIKGKDKYDIGCTFISKYNRLYKEELELIIDGVYIRLTRDNILLLKMDLSVDDGTYYAINLNYKDLFKITLKEYNKYSENLSDRKSIILKNTFE